MQGSKIMLSDAEMDLFCNADVILTKNSIVQKTILMLQEVQEELLQQTKEKGYHLSVSPKISKGENYSGLPYVILDYPRIAKDDNLFFIRSMFWWGNFFSSTLQLSDRYKDENLQKIEAAYPVLSHANYFVGISNDPWVHHFGEDNYKKISSLSKNGFATILEEQAHIKIAARWPLQEWDRAANKLIDSWCLLMKLIS